MPSILAIDWQVTGQLEIRVLGLVMQVGFTEIKDVRFVLEHKCFKICEISPQTSYIGVVDSKRWQRFRFRIVRLHKSENKRWTTVNF